MERIRRIYFYLVAYAGLVNVLVGLAALVQVLLEQLVGLPSGETFFGDPGGRDAARERAANGVALLAVGLPFWALHWRASEGWLKGPNADSERSSALRRLYLYAVLATTALTAAVSGRDLLEAAIRIPVGGPDEVVGELVRPLPSLLLAGLVWEYHRRVAARDRARVGEVGASATLRRWYVYGLAALGVLALLAGCPSLLREIWVMLLDLRIVVAGRAGLVGSIAPEAATVLVGLVGWLVHWRLAEAWAADADQSPESERRSVLRRVFLYALLVGTAAWALVNAGQLLRFGLLVMLGVAPERVDGEPVVLGLGRVLANILVFGVAWAAARRTIGREAGTEPEGEAQAGPRRVATYLVAGVALALLAGSVSALLKLVVDLLLGGQPIGGQTVQRELATTLSTMLVALPVWAVQWEAIQRRRMGPEGEAEAQARTRRIYLYLVTLAAVGVVLVIGAGLAYQLTLALLGQPLGTGAATQLGRRAVDTAIAVALAWYHGWYLLRRDLRQERAAEEQATVSLVVRGLSRGEAERLERTCRETYPAARVEVQSERAIAGPG